MNDEVQFGEFTMVLSPFCRDVRLRVDGEVHRLIHDDSGRLVAAALYVDGVSRSVALCADATVDWEAECVWFDGAVVAWLYRTSVPMTDPAATGTVGATWG